MAIFRLLQNVKNSVFTVIVFSCVFLQRSAEGLISVFPSDKESGIGETVTMYCRIIHAVGNDIEWHHTPYGLNKLNAVYLDGSIYSNYRGRFTVTGDAQQGERNLKISNVSLEDAGKYICMHQTDSHTADLIVFDTFPSSQSCAVIIPRNGLIGSNVCRLEPDNINISCNYSYCGNKVPTVEWKNTSGLILPSVLNSRADVNTSTLIYKAVKDDTFTCYIKYFSSDIQSKFSWTVSIYVHNISHSETVLNIGCDSQAINCAKSRLPYHCVPVWKSSNGSVLSSTALYTSDLSNGLYTCSSQCNIRGTECPIRQQTVDLNCTQSSAGTSNPPESDGNIVVIVIPVLIIIIVVVTSVVTIIFIRRRRPTAKKSDPKTLGGEENRPEAEENKYERRDVTELMLPELQEKTGKQQREAIEGLIEHKDALLHVDVSNSQDETGFSTKYNKRGHQGSEQTRRGALQEE